MRIAERGPFLLAPGQEGEHDLCARFCEIAAAHVDRCDEAGHAHHLLDIVKSDDAVIEPVGHPALFERFDDDKGDDIVKAKNTVYAVLYDLIDNFGKRLFADVKCMFGRERHALFGERLLQSLLPIETDFDIVPTADIGELPVPAGKEIFPCDSAAVHFVGIHADHAVRRTVSAEDDERNTRIFDKIHHIRRRL